MGQKDISLVRYFEDRDRYADLINGFVFGGKQIVSGREIQEMDSRVTGVLSRIRRRFHFQKYRDSVRKVALGLEFAIIGLENQNRIHYAMPIRIMLEDAAGYEKQMRQIQRHHRNVRDLKGAEFLSGFSAKDRVYPVITICIYYGDEPYDGARELFQMMEYGALPAEVRELLNNYRIHVLEVSSFMEIDRFQTDLREVFGFLQRSDDPDREQEFTHQNRERFERLDEDAYDVIAAMTNSMELEAMKEEYRKEGGRIDMCEAIRGMVEAGRLEGRLEGETRIVAMIRRKLLKKKSTEEIKDELELDYDYVKRVVDLVGLYTDWSDVKIAELLVKREE